MVLLGPQFQDAALGGGDQPAHLGDGRGVDPVLGVAERHPRGPHGLAHGLGVGQGAGAHARARHVQADRRAVPGLAEIAGERLLHDDVLAGRGGADGGHVVQGRGQADVDHVDLRPGQKGVEVPGGERDPGLQGEGVSAGLGAGADSAHFHQARGKGGIIGEMHMGAIAGACHTDAKCFHG